MKFDFSEYALEGAKVATVGGAAIGASVAFKAVMWGEVLGVSGIQRGALLDGSLNKVLFLLGMTMGAVPLQLAGMGVAEPLPPPEVEDLVMLRLRILVGAVLVGAGTSFGSGCTTGHGLCGLARLNFRSWVAVPTFMGSGVLTGTLLQSSSMIPQHHETEMNAPRWYEILPVVGCVTAALVLLAIVCKKCLKAEQVTKAKPAIEWFNGMALGCSIACSSMARPSKVMAFLDLGSGAWDPSLCFVMVGGLAVTFPTWQLLARKGSQCLLFGDSVPSTAGKIDKQLVLGSLGFGIGWGISGACPGTTYVMLIISASLEIATMAIGLLLGACIWVGIERWQRKRNAATEVATVENEVVVQAAADEKTADLEAEEQNKDNMNEDTDKCEAS